MPTAIARLAMLALTAAIAAGRAQQTGLPTPGRNALNVSWGDHIVVSRGTARLDSPEHIRTALTEWCERGRITTVYWRISDWAARAHFENREAGYEWYYGPLREILARCDPLAEALNACRGLKVPILAYHTIYDEGCPPTVLYGDHAPFPWQSRFTIEHPEYLVCDRTATRRQPGVLEYSYPEVRQYKRAEILEFLDRYDYDGAYICTRTHSPPAEQADLYGFNPPVVEACRQRLGVDIRTQAFDLQAWRDLRGEGLTQFLRELRTDLRQRGKRLAVGIPRSRVIGPPYGNLTLHWRTWVEEGLVDELVVGVQSGNFHYPSQRGKDHERGYLASGDEGFGLADLTTDLATEYGPACQARGVILRLVRDDLLALPGTAGNMLNAMSMEGHALQVQVAPHAAADLQTPGCTVEFWVRPESKGDWPRLLSKYDHGLGDVGRGWEIMLDDQARIAWRLAAPGLELNLLSADPVPMGAWTHVACGFEAPGRPLFIRLNGRLSVGRELAAVRPRVVPVALRLGAYGGGGRPFSGDLAGLRIWPLAIAADATGPTLRAPAGVEPLLDLAVPAPPAPLADHLQTPPDLALLVLGDRRGRQVAGPTPELWGLRFGEATAPAAAQP